MKLSIISDKAGWIYDAIAKDYAKHTKHKIVAPDSADLIWCLNFWSLPRVVNFNKKFVAHIHHVNHAKINEYDFSLCNRAEACIVPNRFTEKDIATLVKCPIIYLPYWLLSERQAPFTKWRFTREFSDQIFIGSFQKDSDSRTGNPKMVKGPDVLLDIIKRLHKDIKIKVILAGYDRQYVIKNLQQLQVPFIFYERDNDINSLYDSVDWYLVTSREEGGPQSILEASYRKTKILSTPVGMAPEVLHPDCLCTKAEEFVHKIFKNVDHREYNYNKSKDYLPSVIIEKYDNFFEEICA